MLQNRGVGGFRIVAKHRHKQAKSDRAQVRLRRGLRFRKSFYGRLLFNHEDASIGANSFCLGVNHVYNSCFDEQYALKYGENADDYFRTGMGKGFKLDIQQYLVDDGGSKVYIDGSGYAA